MGTNLKLTDVDDLGDIAIRAMSMLGGKGTFGEIKHCIILHEHDHLTQDDKMSIGQSEDGQVVPFWTKTLELALQRLMLEELISIGDGVFTFTDGMSPGSDAEKKSITWRSKIQQALQAHGGKANLSDIYKYVSSIAPSEIAEVEATVRHVIQTNNEFRRVKRGTYKFVPDKLVPNKKRGRKPRAKIELVKNLPIHALVENVTPQPVLAAPIKRGRGRPKKVIEVAPTIQVSEKRSPGRPKGSKNKSKNPGVTTRVADTRRQSPPEIPSGLMN